MILVRVMEISSVELSDDDIFSIKAT